MTVGSGWSEPSDSQLRGESLEFYQSIRNDELLAPAIRLRAQERIDRLMGLQKPPRKSTSAGTTPVLSAAEMKAAMCSELERAGVDVSSSSSTNSAALAAAGTIQAGLDAADSDGSR